MDNANLVKLILDTKHGTIEQYTEGQTLESIRAALVDLNGGEKLNLKSFRNHNELFDIMETVITKTVNEGFQNSDFYNALVDEQTLGEMDTQKWVYKEPTTLVVSSVSRGNQNVRRQRIPEYGTFTLTPEPHVIKVYDEFTRVLAGKINMNDMLTDISKAAEAKRLETIYAILASLSSSNIGAVYAYSGSFVEDSVLDVCEHVSAANGGMGVVLYCTLKAARKLTTGVVSNEQRTSYWDRGYALKWNGIDVIITPQRHIIGGTTFLLDDTKIYVMPVTMDRPIKGVTADGYLSITDGTNNLSFQPEIIYFDQYQYGFLLGTKFGIVDLS